MARRFERGSPDLLASSLRRQIGCPRRRRRSGAGPVRRALRLLALAAGAFAFSLVLGEVLVRLLLPQNLVLIRGDVWLPHDRYALVTAPNVDVPMSAGESRVRFITDSEVNRVGPQGPRDAELRILAPGA